MTRSILWIDDSPSEREAASRMLAGINGLRLLTAASSTEAQRFLDNEKIDCVVTDILRRGPTGDVIEDDGYAFVTDAIRPKLPELPVIFHTKNLPTSFTTDLYSQYLSKWDSEDKKAIELEVRLSAAVNLYEAFAELSVWNRIKPRLETVRAGLLEALGDPADIMKMDPNKFEELVAELLQRIGFKVLGFRAAMIRESTLSLLRIKRTF